MRYSLRHVPEWSIVQLDDGRIGCKGTSSKGSHTNIILFADNSGEELKTTVEVELLKYPAQLAREYLNTLNDQVKVV